jgi:alanyl aminopeptidase
VKHLTPLAQIVFLPALLLAAAGACGPSAPPASSPQPTATPPTTAPLPAPSAKTEEAVPKVRLPADTHPTAETLELHIDPKQDRFSGKVDIAVTLDQPRSVIWLHGKGLNVARAAITPEGGAEVAATWQQRDDTGMASLTLAQPVAAGHAKLHLEYDAPWSPKLEGLYKVTQAGVPFVFTQFESIAARDAFPCFDEPGFKIPWDSTLVVPADLQAISNAHEIERRTDGSSIRVHFAPTLPLPSYLVAFAVGSFDVVSAPDVPVNAVRKRPVPLRAITVKGRGKEVAYALAHTGEILSLLEQYFGLEYPYDKLDILAVPDKGGAMENAGAVTFGDQLLLFDAQKAPLWQKHAYARVMAHELAHQWVGDLVTAAWWDDIWLNEAFATWVGTKVTDQWDPKINAAAGLLEAVQGAMGQDVLTSARAIRQPIESTNDIVNAFDGITYDKGGGVLSMFERWVGKETFQRGLHEYLSKHKFGNATADDFLDAESAAAGKDVKTPFRTFLDQPGVPLVQAETKCDGSPRLHLKQSRYFPMGSSGDPNKTWQIPVCARFHAGKETKEACTLLTGAEGDLPLGGTCPDWVFPNADAAGYFRFAPASADLVGIRTKAYPTLSTRERVAYANSLRVIFGRAILPAKEVFEAAAPLATDAHLPVADAPMGYVIQARDWFWGDPLQKSIEAYGRTLFHAEGQKLGWTSPKGEDPERIQLRQGVLGFLSSAAQDPAVRADAKKRGLAYLGVGKDNAIHPEAVDENLVGIALSIVGEDADRALFDSVRAKLGKTDDAVLRGQLLGVLAAVKKPELLGPARELAFDPSLRTTEVTTTVWDQLGRADTREAAWQWVKDNFDKLLAAVPAHGGQTQLINMGSVFCDEAHAQDVQAFFTPERVAKIEGGPRVLASTLEDVHLCALRRQAHEASEREFFSKVAGKK